MAGKSPCTKCDKDFQELRYLACNHGYCVKCVQEVGNATVMKTGTRGSVTCLSCSRTTNVPRGVDNLPKTKPAAVIRQSSSDGATTRPTLATSYSGMSLSDITQLPMGAKFKGSKLLWTQEFPAYVWDVDFLFDGSIVYIVTVQRGGKFVRELRCLDRYGKINDIETYFPVSGFEYPSGISFNSDTGALAISEWSENRGSVAVLTKDDEDQWDCTNLDTPEMTQHLALASNGDVICTQGNNSIFKMNCKGTKIWKRNLIDGDSNPFVACDNEGCILVSTPNNSTVTTYDDSGKPNKTFPKSFLKQPAGVCLDRMGRVYVSTQDGNIWMYTKDGKCIKKVVDKASPGCIQVYETSLVLGFRNGVSLYQLDFE